MTSRFVRLGSRFFSSTAVVSALLFGLNHARLGHCSSDKVALPSSQPSSPPAPVRLLAPPVVQSTPLTRALLSAFRLVLSSDDQLLTTDEELAPYAKDAHSYHEGVPPLVVVFPTSTEQVSSILRICSSLRIPIVARGGGTSLEGHTLSTPSHRGIALDLSRMDGVLAVRPGDMDCTVQAGVSWQDLNRTHLEPAGLFFPMDPGPGATIGGMVGTGCSGTNAVRYGAMKANVLSLTAVLADGRILRTGGRARKSVAGYDLTSLIVGSEGTLAVVTEATLKLVSLPSETAVAVVPFDTIRAASDAVVDVMSSGVQVAAAELLDANMIRAVNAQSGFSYPPKPHVFLKFSGSEGKVADDARIVEAIVNKRMRGGSSSSSSSGATKTMMRSGGLPLDVDPPSKSNDAGSGGAAATAVGVASTYNNTEIITETTAAPTTPSSSFVWTRDAAAKARLWEARKVALWSAAAMDTSRKILTTDVCVPLSRLPDLMASFEERASGSPLATYAVGHVGDGNVHHFIAFNTEVAAEVKEAKALNAFLISTAQRMEGTCTGEHGTGAGKAEYIEAELGTVAVETMRAIKRGFDPHNILNPGKKLPSEGLKQRDLI